ncbi:MAG: rubredoxin [Pseudomonadota bacterium]
MEKWQCVSRGFVYDETAGLPQEGIAPGTRWQDIPENWICSDCRPL